MKVVIVANSQGTAAGAGAGWLTKGEEYPALVQHDLVGEHDVEVVAESGWSVRDFNAHLERVILQAPDLVLVQIGIVECTRRILSEREKRFFYRLHGGRRITKWLHDHRNAVVVWRDRIGLRTRLVPPTEFRDEIARYVAAISATHAECRLIEIPPFSDAYEREFLRLINDDIETYNQIIREFTSVVVLRGADDLYGIWQPGTVHWQRHGHRLVADRIIEIVRSSAAARKCARQPV